MRMNVSAAKKKKENDHSKPMLATGDVTRNPYLVRTRVLGGEIVHSNEPQRDHIDLISIA